MSTSLKAAMMETEEIIYTVVEDLLKKTGIQPKEVGNWGQLNLLFPEGPNHILLCCLSLDFKAKNSTAKS